MQYRRIAGPGAEPIELADAKAHLRITNAEEDSLIALWLTAAREQVEMITNRALMPQVWEVTLRGFPAAGRSLELLPAPLLGLDAVAFAAADGVVTALDPSGYVVAVSAGPQAMPSRLLLAPGANWPAVQARDLAAVRITYRAGYADAASVPAALRAATLLLLGELYENREASIPTRGGAPQSLSDNPAVHRLLSPYIVWNI